MSPPTSGQKVVKLSPFDLMGPVHFTKLLLFFQSPNSEHAKARSQVIASLARMVKRDPFLAGHVHSSPAGHRYLAFDTMVPEDFDPEPRGMLKFCGVEDEYGALRRGGFAGVSGEGARYHWLEARLASGDTKVLPLLAFQVTFMAGGFVLALWSNHAVLDGASTARVMRLWVEALQVVSTDSREAEALLPACSGVDVDGEVGLQSWHIPPSPMTAVCSERPKGLRLLNESSREATASPSGIVSRTLTFRTKDLQRIRRSNGVSTVSFRYATALLLVAILRARSKAGLIPKDASSVTVGIVSSFRAALNVPATALGNYAAYYDTELPLKDILSSEERLHTVPTVLSKALERICTLISTSKFPTPAQHRLAWLNHQTAVHGINPNTIIYGPSPAANSSTSIVFNTWELLGLEPEQVKELGVLQCIRKPCMPTDGQVLFMPVVGGEGLMRCTVGLERGAMEVLLSELEGWLVSPSAVQVE